MEKEEWRTLPGHDNYLVSSYGRVISKNYRNTGIQKELKARLRRDGYYIVRIHSRPAYVHKLVAMTFLDDYSKDKRVCHLDGDKKNSHVSNLACLSGKKLYTHLAQQGVGFDKFNAMHRTPVVSLNLQTKEHKFFDSMVDAAKELGLDKSAISKCIRGEIETTNGYMFVAA